MNKLPILKSKGPWKKGKMTKEKLGKWGEELDRRVKEGGRVLPGETARFRIETKKLNKQKKSKI